MGFGWPPGLVALATLLVPILIHLARRRARRAVLVGTLRHLPHAAAPQRSRARIVEPWLLAVRMLILALLVLVVAKAFSRAAPPMTSPRSLLVLPARLPDDSLRRLLPAGDSLLGAGLEVHRLPMADLWSELAELDAGLPDGSSMAVATPLVLPMAGARPALRSAITLHRFEGPHRTAEAKAPRTLHVRIAEDASTRIAARRHAAAFRAVAELRGDSLALGGAPVRDGWIVWLPDSAPPPDVLADVRAGATLLRAAADDSSTFADRSIEAEPAGRGRILIVPAIGNPAVDAAFPELIARIWPDPASLAPVEPTVRRISTGQLLPAPGSVPPHEAPRTSLGRILLGIAFALFLLERWLAHRSLTSPPA